MGQYRKRPVVIEARQLHPDTVKAIAAWCGGRHRDEVRAGNGEIAHPMDTEHVTIRTLEGVMRGELGDWIIQGVSGEFYPCRDDIFEQTYEPA